MEKKFSGETHVDIQGEQVLIFKEMDDKEAKYSLIGFNENHVSISDFRKSGLLAMKSLLETNKLDDFAPKFNRPAKITIRLTKEGDYQIDLRDTNEENPPFMLWIAIGIKENIIPKYEFRFKEITPYQDRTALFSLYKRPYPNEFPLYYPYSSQASSYT